MVFLLAALVGLSLGLLGAGGSILAVPILRYAGGLSAKHAVATSLATVGAVSLVGALVAWREGRLRWREGLSFSVLASLGTLAGVRLAAGLSDRVQMALFLAVMAVAWVSMRRGAPADSSRGPGSRWAWLQAVGVGVLTGLVGVGGGFLIVPALMAIYRFPVKEATGTSLSVIAFNSGIGVVAYSGAIALDVPFTLGFVAAAVVGLLAGLALGRRVSNRRTESLFQGAILGVGLYTLWREVQSALS